MNYKKISVIIPSYKDPIGLADTLKSIHAQDYPLDYYEIITVLDVSPVGRARNEGVNRASNEIIAFVDSDMIVPKNWLSEINRLFKSSKVDLAGSEIDMFGGNSLVETHDKLVGLPVSGILARQGYLITAGLVIRKNKLLELGAFREDIPVGEDTELGFRSKKYGLTPVLISKITLRHPAKKSLVKVIKREYLRGQAYAKLGVNWVLDNFSNKGFFDKLIYYLPKNYFNYDKTYKERKEWTNQTGLRKVFLYLFYLILWVVKMVSFFVFAVLFWVESLIMNLFE